MRSCTFFGIGGKLSPTHTFCVLPAPPCSAWGSQRFTREPDSCGVVTLAMTGWIASLGSVKEVPDLSPTAKIGSSGNKDCWGITPNTTPAIMGQGGGRGEGEATHERWRPTGTYWTGDHTLDPPASLHCHPGAILVVCWFSCLVNQRACSWLLQVTVFTLHTCLVVWQPRDCVSSLLTGDCAPCLLA